MWVNCEWSLCFIKIWSHAATSRRPMDTEISLVSVRFSAKSLKSPETSAGSKFRLSCNFNCSNDTGGASAASVDAPIFPTNFHSDIWTRGNMLVNIFHWSTGWFSFCPEHWTNLSCRYIDGTCQLSSVNHMGTYLRIMVGFPGLKTLYKRMLVSPDITRQKRKHTCTQCRLYYHTLVFLILNSLKPHWIPIKHVFRATCSTNFDHLIDPIKVV